LTIELTATAMPPTTDQLKSELAELGRRRKNLDEADEELMTEVEDALRRAYGHVSLTEAAELLNMHRTTIYRVYRPHALN
jgi:transcriptional regulator of acetoin/glycerol metabolism